MHTRRIVYLTVHVMYTYSVHYIYTCHGERGGAAIALNERRGLSTALTAAAAALSKRCSLCVTPLFVTYAFMHLLFYYIVYKLYLRVIFIILKIAACNLVY